MSGQRLEPVICLRPSLRPKVGATTKWIIGPQAISPDLSLPLLTNFSAPSSLRLALGWLVTSPGSVDAGQSTGQLRLELPANGGIRIENLRLGHRSSLEESYVSAAAVGTTGEARNAGGGDRGGFLSIRGRAPKVRRE